MLCIGILSSIVNSLSILKRRPRSDPDRLPMIPVPKIPQSVVPPCVAGRCDLTRGAVGIPSHLSCTFSSPWLALVQAPYAPGLLSRAAPLRGMGTDTSTGIPLIAPFDRLLSGVSSLAQGRTDAPPYPCHAPCSCQS